MSVIPWCCTHFIQITRKAKVFFFFLNGGGLDEACERKIHDRTHRNQVPCVTVRSSHQLHTKEDEIIENVLYTRILPVRKAFKETPRQVIGHFSINKESRVVGKKKKNW